MTDRADGTARRRSGQGLVGAPVGIVALLLTVVAIGAGARGAWVLNPPSIDLGPETPQPAPTLPSADAPTDVGPLPDLPPLVEGSAPAWLGVALAIVVGAILVAVVVILIRRFRHAWQPRRRAPGPSQVGRVGEDLDAGEAPDLSRGADAARRALSEVAEPRDAIVAAWVELEKDADDAGLRRRPWQTPTEFVATVLLRTEADPEAVTALRDLYVAARFSAAPPGPEEVADAVLALTAIEASWRVRR